MLRSIFLTAIVTLVLFTVVGYVSCSTLSDKCASVTCKYGTCSNGTCTCYSGYTGTYCDKRICEVNNTSEVQFENKSTGTTQTVLWDGSSLVTLSPGQKSDFYVVAAGEHTLHFMKANSSNEACFESKPVLIVCNKHAYYCTY